LEFSSKFEVIRTPSKVREKHHSKIRGEDILELGEIVAIRLIVENIDTHYEIKGKPD
jgi:calcium/calmodulin-dependent protein kinase I